MLETLNESFPVARKEHRCMFCGGIIPKGEKYHRTTHKYDGQVYDFVKHEDCHTVAHLLDMYSIDYDGIDKRQFQEHIDEYLHENYYDASIDDIREDVNKLSRIEQVRLILADWDKPFIKAKRLKEQIATIKFQLKCTLSAEYRKLKEERLKKLEDELEGN